MEKKVLLQKFWFVMLAVGALFTIPLNGQTLKHSYTFEDGTYDATYVYDQAGSVDGTFGGSMISVADGKCTVAGATVNSDGWISLDGTALALNTYAEITIEIFMTAGNLENVDDYTMLAYFGSSTPGANCLWMQPTRNPNNESKFQSQNGSSEIYAYSVGDELDDGEMHHVVGILTADALTYYLDGIMVAEATTSGADFISTIGTDVANLFRGVDGWNDPNYNGTIDEFNIYDGVMPENTIKARAADYLGIDLFNATLSGLTVSKGDMTPDFDPLTDTYDLLVPYGSTQVKLSAVPAVDGATVAFFDQSANELPADGTIDFDENGIDVEIVVTALDGTTENHYFVYIDFQSELISADLVDIQLSIGNLTMAFDMDSLEYKAIVPYGTASVDVTGVPAWSGANVTGGGTVTLTDGMGSTSIVVTSEDASATKTYTVDVYESSLRTGQDFYLIQEPSQYAVDELSGLGGRVIVNQPLKNETTQLWQFVESGVAGQYHLMNGEGRYITLSPANPDPWNMEIAADVNPVDLDSCRFIMDEFDPGRFKIRSVKRMQSDEPEKNMMGSNDANMGTVLYSDKWAGSSWDNDSLTIWNLKTPDELFPRDAYLSDLTIDGVTMTPAFSPTITEYNVVLPAGTTSVTITATPEDPTTTVSGDGTVTLPGDEGTLTVTATLDDMSKSKDYLIHYIVDTPLTMMHSYTFTDGTAKDVVGSAHGTVMGGEIASGIYTGNALGHYIELAADQIMISTYPTITLELYYQDDPNTTNTSDNMMMVSFGNTIDVGWPMGVDYLMFAPKSRTAVSNLNYSNPWATESGVNGAKIDDDGLAHHVVVTVDGTSITLYIDGTIVNTEVLSDANHIFNLSDASAFISRSVYHNDNTWMGSIYEYNIYSGVMDAGTVADRSLSYPLEDDQKDATLSDLTIDGFTMEGFHSANLEYMVEAGSIPVVDGTVKVTGATYSVTQATSVPGTATIEVTAADGVTKNTYTIEFSVATGIGKIERSAIKVYPTVSSGEFTVEVEGNSTVITVFDLSGRAVKQVATTNEVETFSLEQKGMYIVKVSSDGVTKLFKVFKNN